MNPLPVFRHPAPPSPAVPLGGTARRRLAAAALAALCTAPPAWAAAAAAGLAAPTRADCDRAGHEHLLRAEHPATAAIPTAGRADGTPQAVWLDGRTLRWPGAADAATAGHVLLAAARGSLQVAPGQVPSGFDRRIPLAAPVAPLPADVAGRFRHVRAGVELQLPASVGDAALRALHRGQLVLAAVDARGRVLRATRTQHPGALDALFAGAEAVDGLGVAVLSGAAPSTRWRLWAPTAAQVAVCLHRDGRAPAEALLPMRRDAATGVWSASRAADLTGRVYTYLVDVFVPGRGWTRNTVTDPYATSLTTDSRRTWVGSLDHPSTKPPGWGTVPRPERVRAAPDMVIYELHVRDFSVGDATVSPPNRGKFAAFTETGSDGMRHLARLSAAGLTDVHLLPAFDISTVPESGCVTPTVSGPPDGEQQQAAVTAVSGRDCFNWGYDPLHFTAPEGSYATDPEDPAVRLREFRAMVQSLHRLGLRVGMDVVYNHTPASGQHPKSVLDRIVPGYYHRLNAAGGVETSTCCDNTATEHRMMAKLMIDSTVTFVRDHRIDSFRFDLMGHQPREAMLRLQRAVDAAAGRRIHLLGEGWNFGEVADGARFRQASQRELAGTGIATFSDRGRDAARGGGHADGAEQLVVRQGWLSGLHHDPNALTRPGLPGAADRDALLRAADLVRVGLAGSIRGVRLVDRTGAERRLDEVDYNGQPAGYVAEPGEVVNYVDNHDNQTLFDILALKLPADTPRDDRARVQVAGIALVAFSQGIAYYHAGIETLRSKSLDRNSYDSGDWFNRVDWTLQDNFFGTGLPPARDNAGDWAVLRPLLANPLIKPTPAQIRFTRDAFEDLLRIRASSALLRLRTADDVQRRLRLLDTGPAQSGTVVAGHLDGAGLPDAGFAALAYFVNAGREPRTVADAALRGDGWVLHPVHLAPGAADTRPREQAVVDTAAGRVTVPPRTAMVLVRR